MATLLHHEKPWAAEALRHAVSEYPNESCGLLLVVRGVETYRPCRNASYAPEQHFVLDPVDYARAEDDGEVLAVVHSHPTTPAQFSDADLTACESSGLPWYVLNPQTEQWAYTHPIGYRAPLVGREWVWGVHDCWALCRDWYAQELGISLRDWPRPASPELFNAAPTFDSSWADTGFRALEADEELERGDLVLLSIGLATGALNHIGVYVGDQLLLHHLMHRLSSQDIYDGWLLKCTGRWIRYAAS